MMTMAVDGYVVNPVRKIEGEYGPYVEVSLRAASTRRQVVYVSARFYGKKIKPLLDFVDNGCYMTMSGCVGQVFAKEREGSGEGGSYFQVYLTDASYSLPPKGVGETRFRPDLPSDGPGGLAGFDA